MISKYHKKQFAPVSFLLALTMFGLSHDKAFAGQGHPGPQMADSYYSWGPGSGPSGTGCLLNGQDANALTVFDGAFVTLACNQVRAGDFWSLLIVGVGPEDFLRDVILPIVEAGTPFYDFVVDAGTPQESSYKITFQKALVRDEDGEPILFDATELDPSDTSGDKMLLYVFPLPPERVGMHTVDAYFTIPPVGIFHEFSGSRTWDVTPK